MKDKMTPLEERAWEAVDQAIFGEKTTRPERMDMLRGMLTSRREAPKELTLGEELKRRRQALKLTPTRMAGKVSVAPDRWRLWEANQAVPTQAELARVSQQLGPAKLWQLRRRAPRVVLGRLLDTRPTLKVARSSGEAREASPREHWQLAVVNLDPLVRLALERHLAAQGQEPSEEALAAALETASAWSWGEQDVWVRSVVSRLAEGEEPS